MKVALLLSSVGLGTYVPGVYCAQELARSGIVTSCFVLESFYLEDRRNRLIRFRDALRDSPNLARAASRAIAVTSPSQNCDEQDQMMGALLKFDPDVILVFSGFWSAVAEKLVTRFDKKTVKVIRCHLDAVDSPSWQDGLKSANIHNLWCFQAVEAKVCCRILHGTSPVVDWSQRSCTAIVHGGGWQLGHTLSHASTLVEFGMRVKYVTDSYPATPLSKQIEILRPSMNWQPWDSDAVAESCLPPLQKYSKGVFRDCGYLHEHLLSASAIVSKPGGGTLIDSFASCTPVIMLPPFGAHEAANGNLWKLLGLGIWWDEWCRLGSSRFTWLEKANSKLRICALATPSFGQELGSIIGELDGKKI